MATKSVFTFKIENEKNKVKIDKIVKEYLNARAFEYNYEKKIYVRMPGKINKTAYAVTAAAGAVLIMSLFSVIIGIVIFLPKIIELIK